MAAAAGYTVHLHDVDAAAIDRGLAAVRANLDKGVAKKKVQPDDRDATLSRLHAGDFSHAR